MFLLLFCLPSILAEGIDCFREDGTYRVGEFYYPCYDHKVVYMKLSSGNDGHAYRDHFDQGTTLRADFDHVSDLFGHDKHIVGPLPDWDLVEKVHMIFLDADLSEIIKLKFDPAGDHKSWYNKDHILESPWGLNSEFSGNAFVNYGCCERDFYISRNHGGCIVDRGLVCFTSGTVCEWERRWGSNQNHKIALLYSKTTTNWNEAPNWHNNPEMIGEAAHVLFLLELKRPETYIKYEPNYEKGKYEVTVKVPEGSLQKIQLGPEPKKNFQDLCGNQKNILTWNEESSSTMFKADITFSDATKCFSMTERTRNGNEYFSFTTGMVVTHDDGGASTKIFDISVLSWERNVEEVIGVPRDRKDDLPPVGYYSKMMCCDDGVCEQEREFGCIYSEETILKGPVIVKMMVEDIPSSCRIEYSKGLTTKSKGSGDNVVDCKNVISDYFVVTSSSSMLIVKFPSGVPVPGNEMGLGMVNQGDPSFVIEVYGEIVCESEENVNSVTLVFQTSLSENQVAAIEGDGVFADSLVTVEFVEPVQYDGVLWGGSAGKSLFLLLVFAVCFFMF